MKKVLASIVLLGVIGGMLGGGVGYALSAPPPPPALTIVLREASGTVTVTSGGDTRTGAAGMELMEGDTVTTGADGEASVEFFDGSRLGIDRDTKIVIQEASVGNPNWRDQDVSVWAVSGRVWTRILKFLDKDSSFEVRHSDVVALVRGTAFLFEVNDADTMIDGFDGVTQVVIDDAWGNVFGDLPSGFTFERRRFSPQRGILSAVQPIPDETRNDPWVREQLAKDEEFARRATEARRAYVKEMGPLISLGTAIRRALGRPTIVAYPSGALETTGIGEEAGPYTLGFEGHSNFQGVRIEAPREVVDGARLKAVAYFSDRSPEKDVTDLASWQVSDPEVATVDRDGTLHAAAGGPITVVARWNDGTHEHSGAIDFAVAAPAADGQAAARIEATTSMELLINGERVQ